MLLSFSFQFYILRIYYLLELFQIFMVFGLFPYDYTGVYKEKKLLTTVNNRKSTDDNCKFNLCIVINIKQLRLLHWSLPTTQHLVLQSIGIAFRSYKHMYTISRSSLGRRLKKYWTCLPLGLLVVFYILCLMASSNLVCNFRSPLVKSISTSRKLI